MPSAAAPVWDPVYDGTPYPSSSGARGWSAVLLGRTAPQFAHQLTLHRADGRCIMVGR